MCVCVFVCGVLIWRLTAKCVKKYVRHLLQELEGLRGCADKAANALFVCLCLCVCVGGASGAKVDQKT